LIEVHFICRECDLQDILHSEWITIDNAIHSVDLSPEIVAKINDHIFLKFPHKLFNCTDGTIKLDVSSLVTFSDFSHVVLETFVTLDRLISY